MNTPATDAGQGVDGWHIVTNKRNQPAVYWFANGRVVLGSSVTTARTFIAEGFTLEPVEVCDKEALANQRATIATLTAQVATLEQQRRDERRMFEDLTPGGSEFHDSPRTVAAYLKDRISSTMKQVARWKAAESQVAALQQELADANSRIETLRECTVIHLKMLEEARATLYENGIFEDEESGSDDDNGDDDDN